jgi:hypothetical protein
VALVLFAGFHYTGARPGVVTVAGDFHRWVRARLSHGAPPAEEPGSLPPLR